MLLALDSSNRTRNPLVPIQVHCYWRIPMSLQEVQQSLQSRTLVTCVPQVQGDKITLQFSQTPPEEPGVYVVYCKVPHHAFYVGEAGNLLQRLTYLFRCYRNGSPHPCHVRHQDVREELPDCDTFCKVYGVRWHSTKGAFGRLEAEEGLKAQFGTNIKAFYINFEERLASYEAAASASSPQTGPATSLAGSSQMIPTTSCPAFESCGSACPVWRELTTNPAYQSPEGFEVPTMTGRRENLRFRSQQQNRATVIRVWRVVGNLDFVFDEQACRAICRRFVQGLLEGRTFADGGTAYFNDPGWANPPLNIINAPFAAAIIRHARQYVGLPI